MKLFNDKIEKKCEYCQKKDYCKKYGSACHSFEYNPLDRVPKKSIKLKEYCKEDFKL